MEQASERGWQRQLQSAIDLFISSMDGLVSQSVIHNSESEEEGGVVVEGVE